MGFALCGTTCTAISADVANCGACGNACASGDVCEQGSCVAPGSLWILTGLGTPDTIALDDDHVYWFDTSDETIDSVPKTGGAKTVVATGAKEPFYLGVGSDPYLYYQSGNVVMRVRRDGSAPPDTVVASVPGPFFGVDADSLFFNVTVSADPYSSYYVATVPLGGGTPSIDFTYPSGGSGITGFGDSVVVDGSVVEYIYNNGSGVLVYQDGTSVSELEAPEPLVASASCAYFESGVVVGIGYGGIGSVPGSGVSLSACFSGEGAASAIYSGNACGIVSAAPPEDFIAPGIYLTSPPAGFSTPISIAPGLANIVLIAVDSAAVYWTDKSGAIGRFALP
jgi:hypothetical protein